VFIHGLTGAPMMGTCPRCRCSTWRWGGGWGIRSFW
jgi:hypothetical protein